MLKQMYTMDVVTVFKRYKDQGLKHHNPRDLFGLMRRSGMYATSLVVLSLRHRNGES